MDFHDPINIWWLIMVLLNLASAVLFGCLLVRSCRSDAAEPENRTYKTVLRIAGTVFVLVSLYRSIFVCSYPSRLTWFDTMLNSPLVIRIFATFAELSYALLVMLPILHINREMPAQCRFAKSPAGHFLVFRLPYFTFICLFTAQFFAYTGLFTQHLILFAIEETLWTLGFLSIAPAAITQASNVFRNHRRDPAYRFIRVFLVVLCTFTVGYLLYQLGYALPFNYYARVPADLAQAHLSLGEGASLALHDFTASHDFDTWGGMGFFIWHSGYFSICTWMNLLFALGPRKLNN